MIIDYIPARGCAGVSTGYHVDTSQLTAKEAKKITSLALNCLQIRKKETDAEVHNTLVITALQNLLGFAQT